MYLVSLLTCITKNIRSTHIPNNFNHVKKEDIPQFEQFTIFSLQYRDSLMSTVSLQNILSCGTFKKSS